MKTNINVSLNVAHKSYNAYMVIAHNKQVSEIACFTIHKNIKVKKILVNSVPVTWSITGSTISYMPDSRNLTIEINEKIKNQEVNKIEFDFSGNISTIAYELNRISEEFIELNLYSPWYPATKNFRHSQTLIKAHGLEDYYVVKGVKNKDVWEIELNDFDSYIIAYKKPIKKSINTESCKVNIIAAKDSRILELAEDMIGDVLSYCNKTLRSRKSNDTLDIVIAPRTDGGGCCRRNLIITPEDTYKNKEWRFDMFLLHEVSHLWFVGANTISWEDWLNESFAEYISLLYIEEKYGTDYYNHYIMRFKEMTKNCPAIKGSDRHSEEGSKIRYKGTLLLHQLREQFGIIEVKEVFNILDSLPIKATKNLIDKLHDYNIDIANFLATEICRKENYS